MTRRAETDRDKERSNIRGFELGDNGDGEQVRYQTVSTMLDCQQTNAKGNYLQFTYPAAPVIMAFFPARRPLPCVLGIADFSIV